MNSGVAQVLMLALVVIAIGCLTVVVRQVGDDVDTLASNADKTDAPTKGDPNRAAGALVDKLPANTAVTCVHGESNLYDCEVKGSATHDSMTVRLGEKNVVIVERRDLQ